MNQEMGWNLEHSYTNLPETFFTVQKPTPVRTPALVILNEPLAASLGLHTEVLQKEGAAIFSGNDLPKGALPIAQAYAGHQFGHFTMLGDGRAVLLGEQITPEGARFDIQLKGPGRTPYSRGGDGRAALGPMLREYIISEAMHALGIPTTRSLAVVTTGETVIRETTLPGAVLARVASSHLRVGTFAYAANFCTLEELKELADYAIWRHYPESAKQENPYVSFLQEVVNRQAALIAKWQLVGFIHGVMNTDNMTISGETIDYGPCAFLDTYDRGTVFSSIDREGRYAYGNQPYIGGWNLTRFAETLLPLLHQEQDRAVELAQDALSTYATEFERHWQTGMRAKLGLFQEEKEDKKLIGDLLALMEKYEADYTNTFRALTYHTCDKSPLFRTEAFTEWQQRWQARRDKQPNTKDEIQQLMRASNPAVIPRNHRVEEALTAATEGDYSVTKNLLGALQNPYVPPNDDTYTAPPPPSNIPYRTFCGT
jgi:uncharacterized protein YdiU (UPF0061 family)